MRLRDERSGVRILEDARNFFERSGVRILEEARNFSILQDVQTRSWGQGLVPESKAAGT